jgi:hypothetical protein
MTSSRSSDARDQFNDVDFDDIDLDRYTDFDNSWDARTNIAVSALTQIDVLRGNEDRTFRPDRTLNRAEFIEIIMRISGDTATVNRNCFPDVQPADWYSASVCRAKAIGIVRGNGREGVPESLWRFEPIRDVQYEEAIKVLVTLFALPVVGDTDGDNWYVPYIEAAHDLDLTIDGLEPGDRITRGEMARLAAAFIAQSEGRLEELRDIEEDMSMSSSSRSSVSSSRSSSRSSMSSSRSSMSSSSSSNQNGSGVFDPDDNATVRTGFLVLGETSSALAGVDFFSNNEPIHVEDITVEFTGDVSAVASLVVYDENGEQLGTANLVSGTNNTFRASIPDDRFTLPRREERSIYIRARTKANDSGGDSGQTVQVDNVTLRGTGEWSDDDYTSTSSETFPTFLTANGTLTAVANAAASEGVLISGTNRELGQFRFTAESPDARHDVRLTSLVFNIQQVGGISLSNVYIRTEGSDDRVDCAVSSNTVTCNNIPASIGTVGDTRLIRVYGDVTDPGTSNNPSLRLSLNESGTASSAGSITWTDGETTFTWVPFSSPVVNGTLYR